MPSASATSRAATSMAATSSACSALDRGGVLDVALGARPARGPARPGSMSRNATVRSVSCTIVGRDRAAHDLRRTGSQSIGSPAPLRAGYRCSRSPGSMRRGLDELVDVLLREADHPAEAVGAQLALVDEPVEAAQRHPEPGSRPPSCSASGRRRASGPVSHVRPAYETAPPGPSPVPPAAGPTRDDRRAVSRAPAVTAAVSARRRRVAQPDRGEPEPRARLVAPTALGADRHDRVLGATAAPRRGRPARATPRPPARRAVVGAATSGSQARRRLGRGLPGHPARAARPPDRPAAPSQRTTERSAVSGTIRSTPSSVSFWTTHSGRSPLAGAKATVIAGDGRAVRTAGPRARATRSGCRCSGTPCRRPPRRSRRPRSPGGEPQHPGEVVEVLVGDLGSGRVLHEDLPRLPGAATLGAGSAEDGPDAGEHAVVAVRRRRPPRPARRPAARAAPPARA